MQPRANEPFNIGSLLPQNPAVMASQSVNQSAKLRSPYQPKHIPQPRYDKFIFEVKPEEVPEPLKVCWPKIDTVARAKTLENWRLFKTKSNNKVEALNQEVKKYNAQVANFKSNFILTEIQTVYPPLFLKNIRIAEKKCKYTAAQYNELVEAFNKEYGMLIEKRKEETLKYASDQVFVAMLHLYAKQLDQFTAEYMKAGTSEFQTVRPFDCNSYHVTALEWDIDPETFVYSLPVCNATVRNHRKKMERAGVFTHHANCGHQKGVKLHFSSEILVLFDRKTGKYTDAENQQVTPERWKDFPDKNNLFTRTFIKINKTENGQANFLDLGTPSADPLSVFYRNTPKQDEKSKLGGAPQNVKVSEKRSNFLREYALTDTNLPTRLASGEFHNYKRIDLDVLEKEAYSGTLGRDEMMILVKHEFFKHLSRIYKNSTPFAGTYQKALTSFEDQFFVSNGNGRHLISKSHMVDKLRQWVWMINSAQRWFVKTGIRPLNPHDYLDTTRTHKKEIGFWYTEKAYKKHLIEVSKKSDEATKLKKQAAIRKAKINHSAKYDLWESRLHKAKITPEQFITFIKDNLPANYMAKIPKSIKTFDINKYSIN